MSCENLLKTKPVEIRIDIGMLVSRIIGRDVIKKFKTTLKGILFIIISWVISKILPSNKIKVSKSNEKNDQFKMSFKM